MIRTIYAEQAHAVPSRAYSQRGLFDPAVSRMERPVTRETEVDEMGVPVLGPGATAQNGFREVKYLRCSLCDEVMPEAETADHFC